jgi:hypothetical protein
MKLNSPTSSTDLGLEHDGVGRPAKGERAATRARLMTVPSHSPVTTTAFLKALDPSADRFTFQLFHDSKHRKLEPTPPGLSLVQHCSCEEASALAWTWHTPEWGLASTSQSTRRILLGGGVRTSFVFGPSSSTPMRTSQASSAGCRASCQRARLYGHRLDGHNFIGG